MGTKFCQQQDNLMDNRFGNIFIKTFKERSHAGKIISPTFCSGAPMNLDMKMKQLSDIIASKKLFAIS